MHSKLHIPLKLRAIPSKLVFPLSKCSGQFPASWSSQGQFPASWSSHIRNAQGNSQQAGLPNLPPSSSASLPGRAGGQEASEEWAGAKPEAGPRPRVLDPADRARAPSLVIINLTTPTINPTMVSNNYRLTLGGGLLWSHVCQGEGGQ